MSEHITDLRSTRARAAPASTTASGGPVFGGDGIVGVNRRRRTKWIVPLVITSCYVLFTLAVHLRMLDSLDIAVRSATHAGEVWGPVQIRAARVVHWLQPAHVALPLVLFVAVLSVVRRSLRPFAVMAVVGVPVIIVTLGTKWVMAHWDPDSNASRPRQFPLRARGQRHHCLRSGRAASSPPHALGVDPSSRHGLFDGQRTVLADSTPGNRCPWGRPVSCGCPDRRTSSRTGAVGERRSEEERRMTSQALRTRCRQYRFEPEHVR